MSESPRRQLVPRSRRLSCDVLHFHRQVPLCVQHRSVQLEKVNCLRRGTKTRVALPVVMLKACSLAAAEIPELRRAWLGGPVSSLYTHPESVAMLVIEREYLGERWLFWGRFRAPEETPLPELQARLDQYLHGDVRSQFGRQLQLSSVPNPLRRALLWWNLNVSGRSRARRMGTFVLSTLAGRGTEIEFPPAFHTANFTYGPIGPDGRSRLTLAYDHRVFDGAVAAEALDRIEDVLHGRLSVEMEALVSPSRRDRSQERPTCASAQLLPVKS
ncbi:MAG: hypothetical protein ACK5Q5_15760 [Planctomycetaceae bacterium]